MGLTRNQSSNPLVHGTTPNQLSQTGEGQYVLHAGKESQANALAQLIGELSCTPKGDGLDYWSGHIGEATD